MGACVASVSVAQRAKNVDFGVLPARKWSRPIFRAGKAPKFPFFALCATETLATWARAYVAEPLAASRDPRKIPARNIQNQN